MYMMARIYSTHEKAQAAVDALIAAGYDSDMVAVLNKPGAVAETAAPAEGEEAAAAPAAPAATEDSVATAIRVGSMLGRHSDFYMQRLKPGNSLLVATPPFIASRVAEEILDQHGPRAVSHEPPPKPFVPFSEQATPFSNLLGLPTLTRQAPIFSEALQLGMLDDGVTHLSRWFAPLADGWTFSSKLGMGFKSKSDTPLSSMLNLPLKSDRVGGKPSSFGMGFKSKSDTPLSSMLGLPTKTKRNHFLYQ